MWEKIYRNKCHNRWNKILVRKRKKRNKKFKLPQRNGHLSIAVLRMKPTSVCYRRRSTQPSRRTALHTWANTARRSYSRICSTPGQVKPTRSQGQSSLESSTRSRDSVCSLAAGIPTGNMQLSSILSSTSTMKQTVPNGSRGNPCKTSWTVEPQMSWPIQTIDGPTLNSLALKRSRLKQSGIWKTSLAWLA